jgi:hypothetical protein
VARAEPASTKPAMQANEIYFIAEKLTKAKKFRCRLFAIY